MAVIAGFLVESESAVKVALHRARKRMREKLRGEIAQLVDDANEVDAELGALFEALA